MGWSDIPEDDLAAAEATRAVENWSNVADIMEYGLARNPDNSVVAMANVMMAAVVMAKKLGISLEQFNEMSKELYTTADPVFEIINADPS